MLCKQSILGLALQMKSQEMFGYSIEVVLTAAVLAAVVMIRFLSRSAISRALRKFNFSYQRRRITLKLINFIVGLLGLFLIISIWGVDKKDLFLFISSIVTVLGIAFFAQWSLLSNISAGLILFFNHPLKLGDTVKILDKDYPIEGEIMDIGYYFVHIQTAEGEKLTVPNSVLLQKVVQVK